MNRRSLIGKGLLLATHHALSGTLSAMSHVDFTIEVIASTVEECRLAAAAGASRVELAVGLAHGGITPPLEMTTRVITDVKIPTRLMLRENIGFELNDNEELRTLIEKAHQLNPLPIDGIVFGYIKGGEPDVPALRAILAAAPQQRFTFHNALERCDDPLAAIEILKALPQIDTLLVNGRGHSLEERAAVIQRYADSWQNTTRSLLVNGYTAEEAVALRRLCPFIREFHFGSQVRTPPLSYPQGHLDAKKSRSRL